MSTLQPVGWWIDIFCFLLHVRALRPPSHNLAQSKSLNTLPQFYQRLFLLLLPYHYKTTMGAPSFIDLFQGATFELVCDNPKGHQSESSPLSLHKRTQDNSTFAYTSPVAGPKKKLQLCRWDSSPSGGKSSPSMPHKPNRRDAPPSLKRMLSPPPSCTLHNVLKPVRRLSFEKKLDDICGANTTKNMSTADILSSVLSNLDLLDEEEAADDNSLFTPLSSSTTTPSNTRC